MPRLLINAVVITQNRLVQRNRAKRADQAADEDVGFGSELSRYITGVRGLPFSISAISTFLSNRRPSADAEGLVSSFLLIRR